MTKKRTEVVIEIHHDEDAQGNYRVMQGHATRAFMRKYPGADAESHGLLERDGETWRYLYVIFAQSDD